MANLGVSQQTGDKHEFFKISESVAVMTDAEILGVAHRMAWRYKHSSDPHHSDTYTFNATTMVDFARCVMAAAASEENREYYCTKHAPPGFFPAKEPPWPFWKCETCGHQAHGWVVRSNV